MSDDVASPWSRSDGFCLGPRQPDRRVALCQGEPHQVAITWQGGEPVANVAGQAEADGAATLPYRVLPSTEGVTILRQMRRWDVAFPDLSTAEAEAGEAGGEIRAPMHGKIARVFVEEGARVGRGDRIAILEAMKMEHALVAPHDGQVDAVFVSDGEQVAEDAPVALVSRAETE